MRGLYVITDPVLMPGESLYQKVEQACRANVSTVQYRNKIDAFDVQLQQTKKLKKICANNGIPFLINDNVPLAVACHADGVHLGQRDQALKEARAALGKNKIIGVTCHNDLSLARKAQNEGADYVSFGRFFPSQTKPHARAAALSIISEAKSVLSVPVVAIGGVSLENTGKLVAQGVDSVAVCHALFSVKLENVAQQAKAFSVFFSHLNTGNESIKNER